MRSALYPEVEFRSGSSEGPLGAHRFTGRIEALQDGDTLLLRSRGVSVRASMSGARIYMLPDDGIKTPDARSLLEERLPENSPRILSWKRMTFLQEGVKVYLVGFLEFRDGVLRMYGSRDVPLLAVLHEGEDVVPRSVWSGRQKNEYWNTLTPWALLAGSMALFVLAMAVLRSQEGAALVRMLLTAALFPVVPLVPPGVVFFILYLSTWRRARLLRAERDVLGLSAYLRAGDAEDIMSGWGDSLPRNTVPLIRACRRRALRAEIIGLVSFFAGFGINTAMTMFILSRVT